MKICPNCAHRNREGYFYCEECGRLLTGKDTRAIKVETKDLPKEMSGIFGTAHFEKDATIVLMIRDANQPVTFKPDRRVVFGRLDPTALNKPDVDLTPYGALENGVSRIHCAIYRDDMTLTIIDLGSANGTHLNGQRLIPEVPRVLRDGDEIQFGKLVAHLYFKTSGT